MGRRSQHTPEQLRELILTATQNLVESAGVGELSAREIARAIGYAPGTLYNMYANLDEILLHVQARFLDEIEQSVAQAMKGRKGTDALKRFAAAYVTCAFRQPHLWSLLQVHHPANRKSGPDWYLEKVYAPIALIEKTLGNDQANGKLSGNHDVEDISRTARLLWSAVHGLVLVATTAKYGTQSPAATISMAENLVESYMAGMSSTSNRSGIARTGREQPGRHVD